VTDSPADKFAELDAIIEETDERHRELGWQAPPRLHAVDAGLDASAEP